MSAVSGDDKLRIPIEIETSDLKELQETLNSIGKAESDLRALPRKGRGTDDSSRAPTRSAGETPFAGGIFDTSRAATPQGRDKTSKQAFQRDNEFLKLRDKVDNIEEATSTVNSLIGNLAGSLGFAGIVGLSADNRKLITSKGGKGALPIGFAQKAQAGAGAASGAVSLAKGGLGGLGGTLAGVASKAFLPAAIAITIYETVNSLIQEFFRPGGFLDRRYRRVIDDEVASLTDRKEKAELQQGIRILRITPVAGFRGESTSTLANSYDRGQQIFLNDFNMESRTKGFFD